MSLENCALCPNKEDPRFGATVRGVRYPLCDGCGGPESEERWTRLKERLGALPGQPNVDELGPLAARIAKGRRKYANGCTVLSLLDEAGEVAHAVNKYEPAERIREELLDVAAVAMRLYFGEIDRGLEIDGLVQRRSLLPSSGGSK
jgi:hypothetical protein